MMIAVLVLVLASAWSGSDSGDDAEISNGAAASTPPSPPDSGDKKETLVFSDLNWASAQVQNRIAQYIVEMGYEHPTDAVLGATLPLFQGLRRGDTHITMEIWLPNQDEAWAEAQTAGEVVSLGPSLGSDWQSAFVIPAYLQEEYPDLDSIDDLTDDRFKALFATAETGGKARLVSCVIGWACEEINVAQIEALRTRRSRRDRRPRRRRRPERRPHRRLREARALAGLPVGHQRARPGLGSGAARGARVQRRVLVSPLRPAPTRTPPS